MKAIEDYKAMLFDVGRVLTVFDAYSMAYKTWAEQPTDEAERTKNLWADIVSQWAVNDVVAIQEKIISYSPANKIEDELTSDDPTDEQLRLRLAWAYKRLSDGDYLPRWNEDNYSLPTKDGAGNKYMYDSLATLKGDAYAMKVVCSLESVVKWANLKVSDVGNVLQDLCSWAGYNPQEQQKQILEASNAICLAVMPNEPQQAAQGQQIGNSEPQQQKTLQDLLPEQLKTDEALKIFQRAIDANLIEKTATGLKWQLSNALLAYLCGIVYCGDTKQWDGYNKEYIVKRGSTFFPDKALSELFGVKNLGQSRLQLKSLPKGYEKVDVLFKG